MPNNMTPSEIAEWLDCRAGKCHAEIGGGYEEAAAVIRELEAKLKIATEALEEIAKGNRGEFESGDYMAFDKLLCAAQALARMKEVG